MPSWLLIVFPLMNTTELRIPSNKVRDIERYLLSELHGLYPDAEIRQMTRMLFEAFLGWDTSQLLLHRDDTINQSDLLRFHWAVEDLLRQRPIQHIIGTVSFCDCVLRVSPDVLIPRPETEEWVYYILTQLRASHTVPSCVVDLCTGSGCVAIALQKQLSTQCYGVDISDKALAVARNNANLNNVTVRWTRCDLLHDLPQVAEPIALLTANPPYVRLSEREAMQRNVLDYEPASALFVTDSDPLLFYRRIAQYASHALAPEGLMVLEINEHLGPDTVRLVEQFGFEVTLHQDFRQHDRFIEAVRHR